MTVMKEKVATRMAAHDRMKNMWVLPVINRKQRVICSEYEAFTIKVSIEHLNSDFFIWCFPNGNKETI